MDIYTKYLVYAIKCVICGKETEKPCSEINLDELFSLAKKHKLENILYLAITKSGISESDFLGLKKYREMYQQAIVVDATQQYYLELIENAFKENKIRYTLLKGFVIKKLYPSTDLRQSADIDILIDKKDLEKINNIMIEIGFKVKAQTCSDNHDVYVADNIVYVEMHKTLIFDDCKWRTESNRIEERLVTEDGYCFKMTDEDYYLFMVMHIAKHLKYDGIGIKAVLDIWIYTNKYPDIRKKSKEYIELAGLSEFEENLWELCQYMFEGSIPQQSIVYEMAAYMSESGWNGTHDQQVIHKATTIDCAEGNTLKLRLKYYWEVCFLSYGNMCLKYGILKRVPCLLPIMWCWRAIDVLIHKRKTLKKVTTYFDGIDFQKKEKFENFRKDIGL